MGRSFPTTEDMLPEGSALIAAADGRRRRDRVSRVEILERFVAACAAAGPAAEAFDLALHAACLGTGADRSSLLLFDPDGVLRFKAWRGLSPEYRAAVEGHTPWTRDTTDAAPIVVADVAADESLAAFAPVILGEGIRALAFVPIAARGQLFGKMMLYYDRVATPDEEALRIAQAIASGVGVLVARENTEDSLRLLLAAGDLLNRSLSFDEALRIVGGLCVPALADWIAIYASQADGSVRRLHHVAADVRKAELLGTLPPGSVSGCGVGEHAILRVLRTGEPFVQSCVSLDDLVLAPDDEKVVRQLDPRSAIVAPMQVHEAVVGALVLVASESDRRYSARDLDLARELARRAAVAAENGRLFDAERAARGAAETANRAKSQFLAVMSHELRTPLTAITGYTNLLTEGITGPVSDAQQRQLARIDASARHLLSLIDEILTFSRLDAGFESPLREATDAGAITREVAAMMEPAIQAQGLQFHVAAPEDGECVLETDSRMLRQILLNLLSNAVRYTSEGAVTLEATPDGDAVQWKVIDTGVGIAPTDLERIFRPFEQVDGRLTRRYGGVGLGLAVSRRLSDLIGGELSVTSSVGRGSSFTLRVSSGGADLRS